MQETTLIFMHANSQPTTKAATMAIGIKENNISTLRKYLPFNIDFYAKKDYNCTKWLQTRENY
ncbi:MAG: hypothetical protein ACJ704_14255 [Nitrososphaeraceae archaeon]